MDRGRALPQRLLPECCGDNGQDAMKIERRGENRLEDKGPLACCLVGQTRTEAVGFLVRIGEVKYNVVLESI